MILKIRNIIAKNAEASWLAKKAYYFLRREAPIVPYDLSAQKIREIVGVDSPTIVEIGCHDGENTRWFVDVFKNPVIHCFEPDPRAINKFKRVFASCGLVQLHPFAIGAQNGRMKFYQSSGRDGSDWDASGSLKAPKNHLTEFPWVAFESEIEVDVRTLDSFYESLGLDKVDLIWMDVQGAEELVISGGRRVFTNARYILTEYNNKELYEGQPTMKQILKMLPSHRVVTRYPDDLLLGRTDL